MGIAVSTGIGRNCIEAVLLFFISEQSILMLSLKLIAGVLIVHLLGYLVQRKMEVDT